MSTSFRDVEVSADEIVGGGIGVIIRVYHLKEEGVPVC